MIESPENEKLRIRTLVRASRKQRAPEQIAAAAVAIDHRLRELVEDVGARSISCFMSTVREPGTRSFLEWALAAGIEVLLPVSREDGLLDWIRPSDEGVSTGLFGIDEPIGVRLPPETISGADLIITPACAADRTGVRLGWGRGYFDRTLGLLQQLQPHLPPRVAVVYDDELFEALPHEAHDVRMSGVVTPSLTLQFS